MTPEDLAKLKESLGIENQDEARENAFARILVMGPAKSGKTTCVLASAPRAFHINCDGDSATKGAAALGGKFLTKKATTRRSLEASLQAAEKLVAVGEVRTVVLDTITLLADNMIDELKGQFDGFELWGEMANVLVGAVKRLSKLDAHLFVIAHMLPDSKQDAAGIMPAIGGSSKVRIPAMLDDWILLDVEPGRKPERQWLLGPQKSWNHSGRNIRRTVAVEATVPALFEELGITL